MNVTNEMFENSTKKLDCPIYTESGEYMINFFNFWIGGVFQSCIAIPGFLGKMSIFLKAVENALDGKCFVFL